MGKMEGKFMPAKFKSICPQTGNSITKGSKIFYSFLTRKAYSEYSRTYQEKMKLQEQANNNDFMPDPADIAADNWYNVTYQNH